MPASIVAANLLVAVVGAFGGSGTGAISGWTPLFAWTNNNSCSLGAFGKIAAGSDTGTFTYGSAADIAAITYQFSGWSGSLADITASVVNDGFVSGYPNPPNHVPTPGAQDYIWLIAGNANGAPTYTAPANYTNLTQVAQGTSCKLVTANRSLNASSEDPAAFSGNSTPSTPVGATIAIPPVIPLSIAKFFVRPRGPNYRR